MRISGGGVMEGLTVFQIYAEIRRAEAEVARQEAAGSLSAAARTRKNQLWPAQAELARRIRVLVDACERMPDHFTSEYDATCACAGTVTGGATEVWG